MDELIKEHIQASIEVRNKIIKDLSFLNNIKQAGERIRDVALNAGTIYSCGNGGSACDAMHLTEELVARYKADRRGYKAMHFLDSSTLTCWSNDYEYESAFERQAETFCTEKDLLIGFSTSGNSTNILKAIEKAKEKKCFTIALIGKDGGIIKGSADLEFIVPSNATERIQEVHVMLFHLFCEFLEPNNQ